MADELKPVYLLTGSDSPKIERALKKLRGYFDESAFEQLSGLEAKGADIVAACNSMGLFGGDDRLVLVTDVDGRRNSEGRMTGGLKAADIDEIVTYLASPAPGTVLALVGEEIKADSALAKAVKKKGDVLAYDASKKELPRWIREQFATRRVPADIEACRRIIELVGENRIELAVEVDRLSTWSQGETVTEAVVDSLVLARSETESFALTDAFGARNVERALAVADARLEQATDTNSELTRLVALLAGHVRRLREVQDLEAQGIRAKEAAVTMKRHPFYVEKLYQQASAYSPDELRQAVVELARLDHALKGGSKEPGELAFVRMLVATVGRREPVSRRAS